MAYVMIVDDDEDFATAMATILRGKGYQVQVHLDTTTCLAEMQVRPPDLVILDAMFPSDDFAGFDLARAMHQSRTLRRIPILMLTAINQRFELALSNLDTDNTWLPVTEFMTKPTDPAELASKVHALLQTAGQDAHRPT